MTIVHFIQAFSRSNQVNLPTFFNHLASSDQQSFFSQCSAYPPLKSFITCDTSGNYRFVEISIQVGTLQANALPREPLQQSDVTVYKADQTQVIHQFQNTSLGTLATLESWQILHPDSGQYFPVQLTALQDNYFNCSLNVIDTAAFFEQLINCFASYHPDCLTTTIATKLNIPITQDIINLSHDTDRIHSAELEHAALKKAVSLLNIQHSREAQELVERVMTFNKNNINALLLKLICLKRTGQLNTKQAMHTSRLLTMIERLCNAKQPTMTNQALLVYATFIAKPNAKFEFQRLANIICGQFTDPSFVQDFGLIIDKYSLAEIYSNLNQIFMQQSSQTLNASSFLIEKFILLERYTVLTGDITQLEQALREDARTAQFEYLQNIEDKKHLALLSMLIQHMNTLIHVLFTHRNLQEKPDASFTQHIQFSSILSEFLQAYPHWQPSNDTQAVSHAKAENNGSSSSSSDIIKTLAKIPFVGILPPFSSNPLEVETDGTDLGLDMLVDPNAIESLLDTLTLEALQTETDESVNLINEDSLLEEGFATSATIDESFEWNQPEVVNSHGTLSMYQNNFCQFKSAAASAAQLISPADENELSQNHKSNMKLT